MSQAILCLPKVLPGDLVWATYPTHPAVTQIEVGVMDASGQRLRGLRVTFSVRLPPERKTGESWVLQLEEIGHGHGMRRDAGEALTR